MSDIDVKLNSNNPIFLAQAVSKTIEIILQEHEKNKEHINYKLTDLPEYKCLERNCITTNTNINLVASRGVLKLVETGIFQPAHALTNFLFVAPNAVDVSGIVYVLYNLLLREMRNKLEITQEYSNSYNLISHPLVKLLMQNKDSWGNCFVYIKQFYKQENKRLCFHGNEHFRPVYFYVFHEAAFSNLMKERLWTFLIQNDRGQSTSVISGLLKWKQTCSVTDLLETKHYLIQLIEHYISVKNHDTVQALILYLTSVLREEISIQANPEETIMCILNAMEVVESFTAADCTSIILPGCIMMVCSTYLSSVLKLCLSVLQKKHVSSLTLQCIKASVLPWTVYPCMLDSDALNLAKQILTYSENINPESVTKTIDSNKLFCQLKNTNHALQLSVKLKVLQESWHSEHDILNWLNKLELSQTTFLKHITDFLMGIFISDFDLVEINIKCLQILKKYFRTFPAVTNNLLVLILFKLSKTINSKLHFELLKSLPEMAVQKENVQLVALTLQSLTGNFGELHTFIMDCFLRLWEEDNRCYTYLEKVLVNEPRTFVEEYYIVKAKILNEICLKRPELHGKEMVPHLSKLLNKCDNSEGEIPSAIALEGIRNLCKSGIIDIVTTWDTLEPRYASDTRMLVIKSVCNLLGEVPSLLEDNYASYSKISEKVLTKLWEYVTKSSDVQIIEAALKALSCFNLEQISQHLPEVYKEENQSKELLNYVPGVCWVRFLQYTPIKALDLAGDFLISLIQPEITSYHRGVYETTQQQREPTNYDYLPNHSVVRAIGNHLKAKIQVWSRVHKEVYLQCLRIFSHEYSRPLPPFTWNFLQELIHEYEARSFCVAIASKQVILSGTARRLMENYITALTEMEINEQQVLDVYRNLKYLSNSIQPMIMRPFLEKSLKHAVNSLTKNAVAEISKHLRSVLQNEKVQDTNKLVIADILSKNALKIFEKIEIFDLLLECITALPDKNIKDLSTPNQYKKITDQQFHMCLKIRCAVAAVSDDYPLEWLNDVIFATNFSGRYSILLTEINPILHKHRNHRNNLPWILNLIGHIQNTLAASNRITEYILLLFDVFVFVITIFSGYDVFLSSSEEISNELLPHGLAALFGDKWNQHVEQILEWLLYVINLKYVPKEYTVLFRECLVCLRNDVEFRSNLKWMKYVETEFL